MTFIFGQTDQNSADTLTKLAIPSFSTANLVITYNFNIISSNNKIFECKTPWISSTTEISNQPTPYWQALTSSN